ncbi:MAG: hypothetical protein Q8R30_02330 [bacterium]|nr:hypothetical protein [bacterium]MDZ4286070.1 hypothetical protein [Candidatus Sungbacteria bacterium]
MQKFLLRGLAEGLVGQPHVMAASIDDAFSRFPALNQVREKLIIKNNTISGFSACDG